jgi:hypothetical protein
LALKDNFKKEIKMYILVIGCLVNGIVLGVVGLIPKRDRQFYDDYQKYIYYHNKGQI